MKGRTIAFRVDASLQMGSGHVMRCLSLANNLRIHGAQCHFISREHVGDLLAMIRSQGHTVHALALCNTGTSLDSGYSDWLGGSLDNDIKGTREVLEILQPDWLIVDHYAVDATWEVALGGFYHRLMVIDDLANRPHVCDVLLDQTFGRSPSDYKPWVSSDCVLLCGSAYALLRPDFAALREYSLLRRQPPSLKRLLLSLGGVDKDNATGLVLKALSASKLPSDCQVTVVMGANAPWLEEVRNAATHLPWATEVRVNVSDMALLMANSDLAIGAAGSTSWERCCLGLPTVMMVLADNQRFAATLLEKARAVEMVAIDSDFSTVLSDVIDSAIQNPSYLGGMSARAKDVTDGTGCEMIVRVLTELTANNG